MLLKIYLSVKKGHNFKVGDVLMLAPGGAAYAITAIATNSGVIIGGLLIPKLNASSRYDTSVVKDNSTTCILNSKV